MDINLYVVTYAYNEYCKVMSEVFTEGEESRILKWQHKVFTKMGIPQEEYEKFAAKRVPKEYRTEDGGFIAVHKH